MSPLEFRIDARGTGRHRLGVVLELDVAGLPAGPSGEIELFLPVWTPGSYLVREYARHLEAFEARDAQRKVPIAWRKSTKNRFAVAVPPDCARLQISYRVYGHELTVRTADFTDRHAYWNGACVCLWPVGGEDLPASFDVQLPDGWQLVTQLRSSVSRSSVRLEAANLDEVVDAPCLAGQLDVRTLDVGGRSHGFVLEGLDGVPVPDELLDDTRRIIEEAAAVFGGELPYDRYEFLALFADQGRGGLEHERSCTLLAPRTTFHPRKDYESFAGLVAHEFFHVWNGKRMRPHGLWAFDYECENYTTLLWVTEGFTAYYDDHLCLRAGVLDGNRYLELLSENLATMHKTPGRLQHPLSAASFDAWIKLYRPDENSRNSTQSYYGHGALAALCFDLRIRALTRGERTLDDAVRDLYRSTFDEGRGFGHEDVVGALSRAAGEDLGPLVTELVDGPFDPDFDTFLEPLGLRVASSPTPQPEIGVLLTGNDLVLSSVITGGPAAEAELSPGDEILAVNGLRVTRANWANVLENVWSESGSVVLLLARRGVILEREVTPTAAFSQSWRLQRCDDADPEAIRLRQAWLCEPSQ